MTITLKLGPEIEGDFLTQARAQGLSPEAYAHQMLFERIQATSQLTGAALSSEEWMREYEAWAHSHDADHFPILSDEAISRDSIYD
jgi:hypothetical protein